ncbi:hypothetical protein ABDZ32_20970 [Aeromonas veronii]|uniref:hypothetical protein n=1 Tax=Aeromonas veronii TaxID=654 RepID=UPI0031FE1FE3
MQKMSLTLMILPIFFYTGSEGMASIHTETVSWQATAIKENSAKIHLINPSLQIVSKSGKAERASLAIHVINHNDGVKFHARLLPGSSSMIKIILNDLLITKNYKPLNTNENIYISYTPGKRNIESVIEAGYDLVAYWGN